MSKDPRQVIVRPLLTEKGMRGIETEKAYPFEVHPDATKADIKTAIEEIFEVKVLGVRTMSKLGKTRRRRYKQGRTRNWKKAVVKLHPDHSIDIL